MPSLVIEVRFHDGRYHGEKDGFRGDDGWPPSPGRLFQALVAGAAHGGSIPSEDQRALHWLEELVPPRIAAPAARRGTRLPNFVPNNDLDAKGGDPSKVGDIRVSKSWRPHFFDAEQPLLYVWDFDPPTDAAERVCGIAAKLYQLGRGFDMAVATGGVVDCDKSQDMLANYPGVIRRPFGAGVVPVACPGTLSSLVERRKQQRVRFRPNEAEGRGLLFMQPPKALFKHVGYDSENRFLYFELREDSKFAPYPLSYAASLMTGLRAAAAHKLQAALPEKTGEIERFLIGRGSGPQDIAQRVRMAPIPSIGMEHTDPSIRRILIEVPPECPIDWRDIKWAFAGLEPVGQQTGRILSGRLVSAVDTAMFDRYTRPAHRFRSVTAVALLGTVRLPRKTASGDQTGAANRRAIETRAGAAVAQALRHAKVLQKPSFIHVQREPLHRHGARADTFAEGSRFSPKAMWHVELRFPSAISGPLIIGDGRFFGLGLMAPVDGEYADVFCFDLNQGTRVSQADAVTLIRSLRRALMSLARGEAGRVGRLFSGHEPDGRPDHSSHHAHVYLAADGNGDSQNITRLIVAAPWAVNRLVGSLVSERKEFNRVVHDLDDLRAGPLGRFRLRARPLDEKDPLLGPEVTWKSATLYLATRNLKKKDDPANAVTQDLMIECRRRGLPSPRRVVVDDVTSGPRGGNVKAQLTLHFATAVCGPILLGRDSHKGGGLFHAIRK